MSDRQTLSAEKPPLRRTMLWSLALNVFLICGIAAFLLSSSLHNPAAGRGGGPAHQFEMLASRLPSEDATVLRAEFAKKSEAIDEAHKAAHRTRDAVRQALSAEPYDIEATRKVIAEAEAAHLRLDSLLQDVIASAAGKMTPGGRAKLADFQPGPPRR
jgi:uncharacterized membrane protein